jgi:hypothetical protein
MTEEQRRLLLARQTWRQMHPSETEVLQAAKRIAVRFQPRKSLSFGRRVRMVSGALATIAGIAYAGSGSWSEIAGKLGRGHATRTLTEEQATALVQARSNGPHDPKEGRTGVVPERLAIDAPLPAPVESVAKPKKKVVRAAGGATRARRAESVESKELASSIDRLDATWADVNAALGSADPNRAESLLLQLADSGRDADTRAKARLGLAQLAASRGDCERARVLALGVAAASGIEMKTVRRALELAVRCAK